MNLIHSTTQPAPTQSYSCNSQAHPGLLRDLSRHVLQRKVVQRGGAGPQPHDARSLNCTTELLVLRQEAVAGVDGGHTIVQGQL